jgi:hypothetical protein
MNHTCSVVTNFHDLIARNISWWGNNLNQEDWHSCISLYFYSGCFRFEYRQKYLLYRPKLLLVFFRTSKQIPEYYLNKTTTISFQIISNLLFSISKLHILRYYANSETRRHEMFFTILWIPHVQVFYLSLCSQARSCRVIFPQRDRQIFIFVKEDRQFYRSVYSNRKKVLAMFWIEWQQALPIFRLLFYRNLTFV